MTAPIYRFLILSSLCLGTAALGGPGRDGVAPDASESHPLKGGWRLAVLRGERPELKRAIGIQFQIKDHRVSGFAGCNRFTGSWSTEGSKIIFSRLASTKMACLGPAMQWEDRFLNALDAVATYKVADSKLQLIGADGAVLARFERE